MRPRRPPHVALFSFLSGVTMRARYGRRPLMWEELDVLDDLGVGVYVSEADWEGQCQFKRV